MGWTAPRDWTVGETVTEDMMDTHIKNNLRYLKGLDGVPTIESGLIIDNTDGDEYVKLPLLSTAEAAAVLAAEGKVAHDETTHRIKLYDGTAVRSVVTTADVDDTPVNAADTDPISSNWAYDFINTLTTAGDVPYATGAGVWARLAKGTALQYLRQNAGLTAPEWAGAPASGMAVYGDGSDGNITIAANTNLSRDMFYNQLTVNNTFTLNPSGYRIFVKDSLTNNGTIARNGNAGSASVGGAALAAGSLGASGAGGDGGSTHGGGGGSGGGVVFIAGKTIVNNSTISVNGGAGGNAITGSSENISGGAGGGSTTTSLGGNGGIGGDSGGTGSPGAAGTATAPTAAQGGFRSLPMAILLKDESTKVTGGAGGGEGDQAPDSVAGGGGGGGGGLIVMIYDTLDTATGTETASAGAGGAGAGGGGAGAAGSAGIVIKITNQP